MIGRGSEQGRFSFFATISKCWWLNYMLGGCICQVSASHKAETGWASLSCFSPLVTAAKARWSKEGKSCLLRSNHQFEWGKPYAGLGGESRTRLRVLWCVTTSADSWPAVLCLSFPTHQPESQMDKSPFYLLFASFLLWFTPLIIFQQWLVKS